MKLFAVLVWLGAFCGATASAATTELIGGTLVHHNHPKQHPRPQLARLSSATAGGGYSALYSRQVDAGDTDLTSGCGSHCINNIALGVRPAGLWAPGYVITQCRFQEVAAGVKDPANDIFLGCDYMPSDDVLVGDQGLVVGVHVGAPNQDTPPCQGSPMIVNDTFWYTNPKNGQGTDVTIVDVNALYNSNSTEVGWLYRGNNGKTYIQFNEGSSVGFGLAVSWGMASVSATTPGAYTGFKLYTGATGFHSEKCFTRGSSLG